MSFNLVPIDFVLYDYVNRPTFALGRTV